MYPHQRRRGTHIAHYQGDSFFRAAVNLTAKAEYPKLAPASREVRRRHLLYFLGVHTNIIAALLLLFGWYGFHNIRQPLRFDFV